MSIAGDQQSAEQQAAVCHGSARDKFQFQLSFDLFDVDGTGEIAQHEMVEVLSLMDPTCSRGGALGLQNDGVDAAAAVARSAEIEAVVARIFALSCSTDDGKLTLLEYMRACLHNPCLVELALQ